jgi:hypothetical protein
MAEVEADPAEEVDPAEEDGIGTVKCDPHQISQETSRT